MKNKINSAIVTCIITSCLNCFSTICSAMGYEGKFGIIVLFINTLVLGSIVKVLKSLESGEK